MPGLIANNIESLGGSIKPIKNIVAKVNSISDLLNIDTSKLDDKEQFHVLGFHEPNDGGGGIFYWDANEDRSNHNGGTVISPDAIFPSDWSDTGQQSVWFTSGGTGNGCWKRIVGDYVTPEMFGAKGDGVTDDTEAIQRVINFVSETGGIVRFRYTKYKITSTISVKPYVSLIGGEYIAEKDYDKNPTFLCYAGENDLSTPQFLLDISSCIKGFTFYYPNQVDKSDSTPTPYGWTISTDTSQTYNIDNITLENLMFINSYNAINLDKAGRFNLRNIYGQPLNEGIYIDRVYDVSRAEHIHFWTFYASTSDALYQYIKDNAIAFHLNRIDQLSALDWFAYGYNEAYLFDEQNNGACWGDFVECCADICNYPIHIKHGNLINFIGGAFTTGSIYKEVVVIEDTIDTKTSVTFTGCNFYGGSSVLGIIYAEYGNIKFTNCYFKYGKDGANGYRYIPLIVSGTSNVDIVNCDSDDYPLVWGGDNVSIDGFNLFAKGNDLNSVLPNFDMSNWSSGVPDKWTVNNSDLISQITNGIELLLTPSGGSTTVGTLYYKLGEWGKNGDILLLEFDFETTATTDQYRFYIRARNTGFTADTIVYSSDYCLYVRKPVKIILPLYYGYYPAIPIILFEWQSYGSISGSLKITNLKLYNANIGKITTEQIRKHILPVFRNPYDYGITTRINGSNKTIIKDIMPLVGNWTVRDIIYKPSPSAGGYLGWVCVRSGEAAPTWAASTSKEVGDKVVPTTDNGYYYECTVAGTTGSSEPTWPTNVGDTVTDGDVTWECKGTAALFKEFGQISS